MKNRALTVHGSAMIGIVSILTFSSICLLCIYLDGTWTPERMLCHLGTSDSELVSTLFMLGCVLSGIGLMVCGTIVARSRVRPWVSCSYTFVVCIGALLMLIGMFDMDTDIHSMFAFAIAFVMGLAMIAMFVDDVIQHRIVQMIVTLSIGAFLLTVYLLVPEYGQTISLVTMLSWTLVRFAMVHRSSEDYLIMRE